MKSWVPCGIVLFGAFGRAFAFAHSIRSGVTGPRSKPAETVRGGGGGSAGAAAGEAGSAGIGGPEGMLMGVGDREKECDCVRCQVYAGKVVECSLEGQEQSGALILVLEAAECGRRVKACLGRFILRHSVARIKCLVIFRLLAAKEGFELLDCEFAAKVSH